MIIKLVLITIGFFCIVFYFGIKKIVKEEDKNRAVGCIKVMENERDKKYFKGGC